MVNFMGEIHRTTDGGETWDRLHTVETFTEETVGFRSVGFADNERGWIGSLTAGYYLWQTEDGGLTIRNITARLGSSDLQGICGLWAVNRDVVYGVGTYFGPARLVKSSNGGLSWKIKNMDLLARRLIDVFFFDENRGFVVGGSGSDRDSRAVILATEDGGATWETRYTSQNPGEWGWKISFPTPEIGYVSVERFPTGAARVLKTTDGGKTWSESVVSGSRPLQGIGFTTESTGWASGRGTTSTTTDGGLTWRSDSEVLDGVVNRFRMFGDTLGYAVGERVYKYSIQRPVSADSDPVPATISLLRPNYPNPFYPLTTFEYETLQDGYVEITVLDLLGRQVKSLVSQRQTAGAHRAVWDGSRDAGGFAAAGVYLYTLRTSEHSETRRMVYLKP